MLRVSRKHERDVRGSAAFRRRAGITALAVSAAVMLLAPLATPASAADLATPLRLETGHIDAFNLALNDDNSIRLTLKEDVTGYHVLHTPESVELFVKRDAHLEGLPPAYLPAGSPTALWYLPLTQDPNLIWPGWDSQDVAAAYGSDAKADIVVSAVDGPGQIYLWSSDTWGLPKKLLTDGWSLPGTIHQDYLAHVHANWGFTASGAYKVTAQVTVTSKDGTRTATSNTGTYTFIVQPLTDESPSAEPSASVSESPSAEPSPSVSESPSAEPSPSVTASPSPSGSVTLSPSPSPSPTSPSPTAPVVSGVVTAVSAGGVKQTYGKSAKLAVKVSPRATGRVSAVVGSKTITGSLSKGKVTLTLPARSLVPGKNSVVVSYLGVAGKFRPSARAVTVSVTKASASVKAKVKPAKVKRGKSVSVSVVVTGSGVKPTGTVTVKLAGGSRTLVLGSSGKVTVRITVPNSVKPGLKKASVHYNGDRFVSARTKTVKLRVTR